MTNEKIKVWQETHYKGTILRTEECDCYRIREREDKLRFQAWVADGMLLLLTRDWKYKRKHKFVEDYEFNFGHSEFEEQI